MSQLLSQPVCTASQLNVKIVYVSFVKINLDDGSYGYEALYCHKHRENHSSIHYWFNTLTEDSCSQEFLPNVLGIKHTAMSKGTEERNKKGMRVCKEARWTGKENDYKSVIAFEAALCTWALILEKRQTERKDLSICESNYPHCPLVVVFTSNPLKIWVTQRWLWCLPAQMNSNWIPP